MREAVREKRCVSRSVGETMLDMRESRCRPYGLVVLFWVLRCGSPGVSCDVEVAV